MSSDLPPHEQRWRAVRKARFRVAADLQSDLVEADEIEPGTVVVQISRLVEIEHKNPSGHVLHVRRCKVRVEETGFLDSILNLYQMKIQNQHVTLRVSRRAMEHSSSKLTFAPGNRCYEP